MSNMTLTADGLSALSAMLPGEIEIERGTREDYFSLAHLHYAPGKPATWAGVWRAEYRDFRLPIFDSRFEDATIESSFSLNRRSKIENRKSRTIAVGVLSYPTPSNAARDRVLGLSGPRYGEKLAFVNRHIRTISRVIVHPQFRGLGLASLLVRRICNECPTRYVEAIAAMGEVHPFFERGGMRKIESDGGVIGANGRAYFIFDRAAET